MSTEPIDISVNTQAGVEAIDDPAGTVTVVQQPGDTTVELVVWDGHEFGKKTIVYLDYSQVTALMVALGQAAGRL